MQPDEHSTPAGTGEGSYGWGPGQQQPPHGPPEGPRRRRSWLEIVAVILAVIALVVGVIALVERPTAAPTRSAATTPAAPAGSAAPNTADADRALCQAIAPLMTESDQAATQYINTGAPGTPQRDAAIPKYREQTEGWARRIQAVLDAHPDAQPYLKRTLQRFIDDEKLFVANVRPGPATKYDDEMWSDSLGAVGGPLAVCQDLGVQW